MEEVVEYLHMRGLVDSGLYKLDINDSGTLIIRDEKGKEIFSSTEWLSLEKVYKQWKLEQLASGSQKEN